jgi:hypothetical protein
MCIRSKATLVWILSFPYWLSTGGNKNSRFGSKVGFDSNHPVRILFAACCWWCSVRACCCWPSSLISMSDEPFPGHLVRIETHQKHILGRFPPWTSNSMLSSEYALGGEIWFFYLDFRLLGGRFVRIIRNHQNQYLIAPIASPTDLGLSIMPSSA